MHRHELSLLQSDRLRFNDYVSERACVARKYLFFYQGLNSDTFFQDVAILLGWK